MASKWPDVERHRFQGDIEALDARGLVGVPEGSNYRPDDPITRGESAAYLNRVLNYLGETVTPPPVDPPAPPPSGLFIPGYDRNPILGAAADAPIVNGFTAISDETLRNVKIRGKIIAKGCTVTIEDFDWDGQGGNVCGHSQGGKIVAKRGKVYNAEDGFKNSVDLEQVWISDLFHADGAHGDCLQAEGTTDSFARFCFLNAVYSDGQLANAALMAKTDISSSQKYVIEDSFINGGNYTVKVNIGNAGGEPDVWVRRSTYGGQSRYGSHAGPFREWDVTS